MDSVKRARWLSPKAEVADNLPTHERFLSSQGSRFGVRNGSLLLAPGQERILKALAVKSMPDIL
ncbi:uncharacterized protein PADG_11451 [Paracoccidioides brasiliensis Pb18]|uniref:Uncharacterized protein n=2 Tax=Paracoccidioides brasiliensis TaxID=121759 RepID=A0A0A0HW60_PARBD|nr:uncharacterized protein PADG_11451 [Paracoccidioides brasiliensis Pb18]KGM92266.1 hypothetical protein PADG_11451 [Paracoccidioides brasiliensis Pb18]ODH30037.1 hypothetical protein ACO22_03637 [Paracoccidioides brasiliensis]